MIATQRSSARENFARTLESARRKLRETIERHPGALPAPADALWRRGFFPGMLWLVAGQDPLPGDAEWWRGQAVGYSKLLAGLDGDGLGFALLPSCCRWAETTRDPFAEQVTVDAARRIAPRLGQQEPTIPSLMDAILLFHASAISGDPELGAIASAHALVARRLLVRGDGSLSAGAGSSCDLAFAIHAFGAAYQFTRDPRFLGVAENCAACFLETLPGSGLSEDPSAGAVAASALLQLASLAADSAKARFYTLTAQQFLAALEAWHFTDAGAGDYFYLDAVTQSTGQPVQLSGNTLLTSTPQLNGASNGVVIPSPQAAEEPVAGPTGLTPPEAPLEREAEAEPEAGRKPVRVLTFLLAPIIFFLLVELLIFRTNYYVRFVEPESAVGTFEATFQHEVTRARLRDKEVIVLGSSRIAEGFSAKRINQLEPGNGYWFINGAVSGAGPRCMYYMVRDLDPRRNRYAALVLTIDDYTDQDDNEDFTDRLEDLYVVTARLRFSDVFPFMQSFSSRKSKWAVLKGTLLKSIVYQRDVQEFLDHPSARLDKLNLFRGRFNWEYDYTGSEHNIAGTTIDWSTMTIHFPPGMPVPEQDYLRPRLYVTAPQIGRVRAFQTRWLGAIADLYRDSKTRIIFIQPPRTGIPRPVPLAHFDWTTVDALAKRPWVTIVDRKTFASLERPELFSDHAHLNSEGQRLFSPALANTVKSILEGVR